MIDVVVVTGPCGAGKSSVGFEAMDRLARAGVRAAFVDGVLARREVGEGLDWHVRRAAEIARSELGEPVDAERPLREVVDDVLARTGWV